MNATHCPACGAPQSGPVGPSGGQCEHCGGPIVALGAPDPRNAMPCHGCGHLVADGSTFCPHCGTAMADRAATAVGQTCPGCGAQTLVAHGLSPTHSYREGWQVSGCNSCGGVWVDSRTLDAILERAAQRATLNTGPIAKSQVAMTSEAVRYRGCPVCGQLMMRRNFARISGVIVDQCRQHGTWFDPGELDAVLRFVASGGLAAAHARETKELETERRRVTEPNPYAEPANAMMWTPASTEFALLDAFFAFLRGRRFWRF